MVKTENASSGLHIDMSGESRVFIPNRSNPSDALSTNRHFRRGAYMIRERSSPIAYNYSRDFVQSRIFRSQSRFLKSPFPESLLSAVTGKRLVVSRRFTAFYGKKLRFYIP